MYTHRTVIDTWSSLPDHKRIQRETKVYDFCGRVLLEVEIQV